MVFFLAGPYWGLSQNLPGSAPVDCSDPQFMDSAQCDQNPGQNPTAPYGTQGLPAAEGHPATESLQGAKAAETLPSQTSEGAPLVQGVGAARSETARAPEPPTEFQKFVAATTGQLLPIFGANLFQSVPSTFAPSQLSPASPDYVIGPDDELRIRIWGQVQYSDNLRVDRSGNIYLPQVGSVHVAGLHFQELDRHLREAMGRIYKNFDLSVDLGRIRSIRIYVTGEARRPGAYMVSSLSTLVDALFASGGPSAEGSLRHVLLNRGGKTVADFDLYALLIRGDKSGDVPLLPEDVLYIPPAGSQAAITGSVRNPAIYELLGGESIGDLLEAAGKTTAVAAHARISLERLNEHQARQAMEFAFDKTGLATPLADGDIVRIYSILPAYEQTVTLRGFVANPGRFRWQPGMHLSDLIPDQASLMSRDYWWKRSYLGLPAPEFEPAVSSLESAAQMPGAANQDITAALSQQTPGSAPPGCQDPMGCANAASPQTGPSGGNTALAAQVRQPSAGGTGEPGRRNEVRLSAAEINWDYAVVERIDPVTLRTSLLPFDLRKLLIDHDAAENLALQPGDTITIFSQADIQVPIDHQTKYVELEGEFVHPGVYSAQPNENLRDLVRRAGGLSPKAYLYGSELTRQSTRVFQQQRIDEYIRTVSAEAARGTQGLALSGASGGNTSDLAASRAVAQDLVARLSQIRATGRIVLDLRPESSSVDDLPALGLENGDRFVVPSMPATINVVGAVYDQNSFIFRPGKRLGYYLRLAGGANRNADSKRTFVIRADGSVVGRPSDWSYLGDNGFSQLHMNPGDTIVVPDKTLRPNALRGALEWTQLFSQFALGAAAINVIQ